MDRIHRGTMGKYRCDFMPGYRDRGELHSMDIPGVGITL